MAFTSISADSARSVPGPTKGWAIAVAGTTTIDLSKYEGRPVRITAEGGSLYYGFTPLAGDTLVTAAGASTETDFVAGLIFSDSSVREVIPQGFPFLQVSGTATVRVHRQ